MTFDKMAHPKHFPPPTKLFFPKMLPTDMTFQKHKRNSSRYAKCTSLKFISAFTVGYIYTGGKNFKLRF